MRESSGLSVPCLPPCRTWLAVRVRGARTINSRNRSSEPRNVASCETSSSAISPSRLSAVKRSPTPWRELDVLPGSRPLMPVFLRAFPLKDDSASVSQAPGRAVCARCAGRRTSPGAAPRTRRHAPGGLDTAVLSQLIAEVQRSKPAFAAWPAAAGRPTLLRLADGPHRQPRSSSYGSCSIAFAPRQRSSCGL